MNTKGKIKMFLAIVNVLVGIVSIVMLLKFMNHTSLADYSINLDENSYRKISGQVLDNEGTPYNGITVNLYSNNDLVASVTTNSEGIYEFRGLKEGNYTMEYSNCNVDIITMQHIEYNKTIDNQTLDIGFIVPKNSQFFENNIVEEIKAKLKSRNIYSEKIYEYDDKAYYIKNKSIVEEVGYEIYDDLKEEKTRQIDISKNNKIVIINLLDRISPATKNPFGWISNSNDDDTPVCFYTATLGYNNGIDSTMFQPKTDKAKEYYYYTNDLQDLVENIVGLKIGEVIKTEKELGYSNSRTEIIEIEKEHDNYNTENIKTIVSMDNLQGDIETGEVLKPGYSELKTDEVDPNDETKSKYYIRGRIKDNDGNLITSTEFYVKLINLTDSSKNADIITKTGEYSFDMPQEGDEYRIEITYGIGTYNWQDYEITPTGDFTEDRSILNGKKIDYALYEEYDEMCGETLINNAISNNRDYTVTATSGVYIASRAGKDMSDIIFRERDYTTISVEKKLSKAKVTLADGQVLREEDYSGENAVQESVPAYWYIDDEIMHGATIQLEYEIKITSNKMLKNIELLDYLSYDNSTLIFDSEAKMLTDSNITNEEWSQKTSTEIESEYREKQTLKEGAIYLTRTIDKLDDVSGSYEKTIYLIASKLVTSADNNLTYDNVIEVMQYENNGQIAGKSAICGDHIQPGNYDPESYALEADTDDAKQFIITKPTGCEINEIKGISNMFDRMKNVKLYRMEERK